ncbi:glycosyltransferase [Anaerolineales bacterium HSG24]|nr:glycosyltransferase [Anaerolineales bacterium HSG24]
MKRILRKFGLMPSYVSQQLNQCSLDLIHYPGTTIDQLDLTIPYVVTMHDIQYEYHPQFFDHHEPKRRQKSYLLTADKAKQIITISHYTQKTIHNRYHVPLEKIKVIYQKFAFVHVQSIFNLEPNVGQKNRV